MADHPAVGRVLVVDDNENNRDVLLRRLSRAGHAADAACDGAEALDMIAARAYDVVLLDVMMPGIDGFEVLRRIRATHPALELPVIMATARDQREDIVRALELGASDYVTKPLDFPVVLARVDTQLALKRAADRVLALEADLERRNAELEAANRRMRADLRTAARVQQALLPTTAPAVPGVNFCWDYHPCQELGGDILNVFRLDERHIGMYVLDVSGHGVPAALLSVTLSWLLAPVAGRSSLVRREADGRTGGPTTGATSPGGFEITPPADVVAELNQRFQISSGAEQYFTLVYGVLDLNERRLRYISAGHPGPVYAPRTGSAADLSVKSFPIGWIPDSAYAERTIELAAGDRVYLYSDGIQEAKGRDRSLFGAGRIFDILTQTRAEPLPRSVARLVESARAWAGGEFDDDVSLLALEIED